METPVKTGAPPAPPVTPATVAAATPTPSKRMPTATPAPSSTPGPSKPAMSEAELRQKLRPVFDAFDTDGSGAVSTSEMTAMVAKLQMTLGPEEIAKLMADADPDGSGEVDFDEFVVALKRQLAEGGEGALGSVFTQASSSFGWLNPFSWFAEPEPPPPPKSTKGTRGRSKGYLSPTARHSLTPQPPTPHAPTGAEQTYAVSPRPWRVPERSHGTASTTSSSGTPLKTKATQIALQEQNLVAGDGVRELSSTIKALREARKDDFLERQRAKVAAQHQQEAKMAEVVATTKATKNQQRKEFQKTNAKRTRKAEAFARSHANHGQALVEKAKKTREGRAQSYRESLQKRAASLSVVNRSEREERRQQVQAVHDEISHQTKAHTDRVKVDTRPELRQEGRDTFQAQKELAAQEVKELLTRERQVIEHNRQQFAASQAAKRDIVRSMLPAAHASRGALAESRWQEAQQLREKLDDELERGVEQAAAEYGNLRAMRDEVFEWRKSTHEAYAPLDA